MINLVNLHFLGLWIAPMMFFSFRPLIEALSWTSTSWWSEIDGASWPRNGSVPFAGRPVGLSVASSWSPVDPHLGWSPDGPLIRISSGGRHIRSANDLVQATDLQEMSGAQHIPAIDRLNPQVLWVQTMIDPLRESLYIYIYNIIYIYTYIYNIIYNIIYI